MTIIMATVIGLIIGSFLNVVIYRLPIAIIEKRSLIGSLCSPKSTAPCCKKPLLWYENIPVFSWLLLAGNCGHCGRPISPRYCIVELLTGAAFGWSLWQFGETPLALIYATLFSIAIALFFIDLETFLLPDYLTYSMLALGLLATALGYLPRSLGDAVFGSILGFSLPWAVNKLYFFIRKHDGFGGGDFKLLAAIGAWTGWPDIVPVLCLASIIGLVMIGTASLVHSKKIRMQQAFPFGPFLILSGLTFILQSL